ncbi:heme lyase CcmF/NrfE family subunit [Candidatus Venteria ishoeyi]|uniref:heme lyase CcmF/NrfE family subunit n=1 Tax=Candidatus Venteria ishoeyi TaxID=1899563 RepID=UPI0025A54444|nr:heme lyase CcmF/NrfE family subunit [Candidatus Venteria ishoeyi]MDM8547822.1 heme lyase CcmF/NrfE family subunit [Candidatus Venteria ishoeyi]
MVPELGHFALILALCLAIVQTVFPLIGTARNIPNWMAVARPAATGQWVFMLLGFACLTYSFIYNDFSVAYAAQHSNSNLPLIYRISAVWGGHEGSLLLWVFILSSWTVAVAFLSRSLPEDMAARVLAVMGFISIGFLLFMIMTSNPFDRLFPIPMEGRDLNPLLQDPGLIIHPPMLYMGYVGFSVAFAFSIAALLGGNLDSAWARWSRPWTVVAWVFLTAGISLGSWWAYYELGWGGWWFWDPVENASFMPWLVGTALMHSLIVTEKRGTFKTWTVLLAITTFSLSLLGTFLVRSGVLTSVHAFATDPKRGVFILAFLVAVVGFSLVLYAWRAPTVGKGGRFSLFSRESLLLFNNVLLIVAAAVVLLGTLYPLFMDALGLGKISVGPPYFDTVFFYIMIPLVILMGLSAAMRWKKDDSKRIFNNLSLVIIISIVGGFAPVLLLGKEGWTTVPGMMGGLWVMLTSLQGLHDRSRNKSGLWAKLKAIPRSYYAMMIAHFGFAVTIIGIVMTNAYSIEKDIRLQLNKPLHIGEYVFELKALNAHKGPNYIATRGQVEVYKDGTLVTLLEPEKRNYPTKGMPMTEAAIDPGFWRDIYVALGEPLGDSKDWSARVYYKPFIRWIWLGSIFMMLAGFLSVTDRRYRRLKVRDSDRIMASRVAETA